MQNQTTQPVKLPWWLKSANRVIIALNRLGVSIGSQYILTIVGRKSGKPYSTPVSILTINGERYICTAGEMGWVKNARVAGTGTLSRGRSHEQVILIEMPVAERGAILRQFPLLVPHGVAFFTTMIGIANDPEAFAAAAPQCPVFHIQPLETR